MSKAFLGLSEMQKSIFSPTKVESCPNFISFEVLVIPRHTKICRSFYIQVLFYGLINSMKQIQTNLLANVGVGAD